jgi:2-epi-5-epi-valiolone synthase
MSSVLSEAPGAEQLSLTADRTRTFAVRLVADLDAAPADIHSLGELVARRQLLVCTTPTVEAFYGARLRGLLAELGQTRPGWLVLHCTEATKTMESVLRICWAAQEYELDRNACLLAFGGGVCSDLVTVAASQIRRGIGHVRVPTTLIGQVDAGVGIKGAANLGSGKNYLGCFHPPEGVIVAPQLLRSLPLEAMRQGMAEIVKMAIIRDGGLFELLRREGRGLIASRFAAPAGTASAVLVRAIQLMLHELASNPFEDRSHARAVDFGHTVSPALEAETGYTLHHGYAVAIDIAFSTVLAQVAGLIPAAEMDAILDLLLALGLPIAHPALNPELVRQAFAGTMRHRGGALNLVVPTRIGAYAFLQSEEIGDATLHEALSRLNTLRVSARGLAA